MVNLTTQKDSSPFCSSSPNSELKEKLALTLQRSILSVRDRALLKNNLLLLDKDLFAIGKAYIDEKKLKTLPMPVFGNSNVYLPPEPIVIKESPAGQRHIYSRIALLYSNMFNCQDLIIPRSQVYGDYVIEEKIPSLLPSIKAQLCLYGAFWSELTHAVAQFCALLFHSHQRRNLISINGLPYSAISARFGPVGRCDNVCIVYVEKNFFIALPDLEWCEEHINEEKRETILNKVQTLIHLFPFHTSLIIDIAKSFQIDLSDNEIKKFKYTSQHRFKLVYTEHKNFIERYSPLQELEIKRELVFNDLFKFILPKYLPQNEFHLIYGIMNESTETPYTDRFKKAAQNLLEDTFCLILNLYSANRSDTLPLLQHINELTSRTLYLDQEHPVFLQYYKKTASHFETFEIFYEPRDAFKILTKICISLMHHQLASFAGREIRSHPSNNNITYNITHLILFF